MGWAAAHSPETVAAMSVGGQSRHFDRGPAPSGLPRSTDIAKTGPTGRAMNGQRHCLEFTADRIMVRCSIGSRYR